MSNIGANGLKEVYMKLASFGALSIEVTPLAKDPEIMTVDIGAQNRRDTMSMTTNKDETIDQFCSRIRSMLRALVNAEPRTLEVEKKDEKKAADKAKTQTWDEQKAGMKDKGARV